MSTRTPTLLSYTGVLAIAGAGGGWAIATELAGNEAGLSFLRFSVIIGVPIFMALIGLYKRAARKVTSLILFNIACSVNLIWCTSCLFLPLFWMSAIHISVKAGIGVSAICLYFANLAYGMQLFKRRWVCVEDDLLRRYYDKKNRNFDWHGVARSLKLNLSLYIPNMPEVLSQILSAVSILSMISGFLLSKVFPVYSVFAWGIPVIIINSIFVQMIGVGIAQVFMVRAIEKKDSVELRPR